MSNSRAMLAAMSAALMVLLFVSCSYGPSAPSPGTPAYYWAAANDNWKLGDYVKTLDNLDHITATQSDFTARARPWQIVLQAGVGQAYLDLGQALEDGARVTRERPAEFRRPMNDYRSGANRMALQLAASFGKFAEANKDQAVHLEFPWPAGNSAMPDKLARLAAGTMQKMDELDRAVVQRDVILAAARATGSGADVGKAQAIFQSPDHAVPAEQFNTGIAKAIFDLAALYGPAKMDMPNKRDLLYAQAMGVLRRYPKNKDAADITTKIQKQQKKKATAI